MQRTVTAILLTLAGIPGCIAYPTAEDNCILSVRPAYVVRGRLLNADGSGVAGATVRVVLVPEDGTLEVDPAEDTTDEQGRFMVSWPFGPMGDFVGCVSEEEVVSLLSNGRLAPPLR